MNGLIIAGVAGVLGVAGVVGFQQASVEPAPQATEVPAALSTAAAPDLELRLERVRRAEKAAERALALAKKRASAAPSFQRTLATSSAAPAPAANGGYSGGRHEEDDHEEDEHEEDEHEEDEHEEDEHEEDDD